MTEDFPQIHHNGASDSCYGDPIFRQLADPWLIKIDRNHPVGQVWKLRDLI
jgi:hypothetical protein